MLIFVSRRLDCNFIFHNTHTGPKVKSLRYCYSFLWTKTRKEKTPPTRKNHRPLHGLTMKWKVLFNGKRRVPVEVGRSFRCLSWAPGRRKVLAELGDCSSKLGTTRKWPAAITKTGRTVSTFSTDQPPTTKDMALPSAAANWPGETCKKKTLDKQKKRDPMPSDLLPVDFPLLARRQRGNTHILVKEEPCRESPGVSLLISLVSPRF